MATESVKQRQNQTQDLYDLQSNYERKKKKIHQDNQGQIQEMKEEYVGQKEEVRKQNEAAISHLQKKQQADIEKAQARRNSTQERGLKQTTKIEEFYQNKIQEAQKLRQQQVKEALTEARQKTLEIEQDAQSEVEKTQSESMENLQRVKSMNKHEIQTAEEYGKRRYLEVKKKNEELQKMEFEKGKLNQEKVRAENNERIGTLQQKQDGQLKESETLFQKKVNTQKQSHEKEVLHQKKSQDQVKTQLETEHAQFIARTKNKNEDQIRDQNKRFEKNLKLQQNEQQTAVQIERGKLAKQLAVEKQKFIKQVAKYDGKAEDPFYKVYNRGSELNEDDDFYYLSAYVPKHEVDTVKVNIQQGRALVSGQRSFQEKAQQEGKVVTSSSYQNFREEFPLSEPVVTEGMTRARDGDYVHIKIPKFRNRPDPIS